MKRLLQLVLIFIVGLMVLTVLAYQLMGWSGLGLLLVLMIVGAMFLKAMAGKLLQKAFVTPFMMKGEVLKNANAEIHSIEPATRPARTFVQHYNEDDDELGDDELEIEDEDSNEYSRHYTIDVTITPQATDGAFQHWEPLELILVKPDAQSAELDSDDAAVGSVLDVEVWNDGIWIEDEGMKYSGPQRVRLLVGVQEGIRSCRFRYYFEVFGNVELVEAINLN